MDNEEKLGKFRSTDELLKAYTALESEFTKRCQRLKEAEMQIAQFKGKYADEVERETVSAAQNFSQTEQSSSKEAKVSDADKAVAEYLKNRALQKSSFPRVRVGGYVLSSRPRPKDLKEAKRIVEEML